MKAKRTALPTMASRQESDGCYHTYDKNGRGCLDLSRSERVILIKDLRVYDANLHIGAMGWTVPANSDGYKSIEVRFDSGSTFVVFKYAFQRVEPVAETRISEELIARYRNTRFDKNTQVASDCQRAWATKYYAEFLELTEAHSGGVGDQEIYAFTFPSLQELALLKKEHSYPVKIGFSKNASDGASGRIRSMIFEKAAYPERPVILLVWKTWDGFNLEQQVHRHLRKLDRKVAKSLGKEWFLSSRDELVSIIGTCTHIELPKDRVLGGADESMDELAEQLAANGERLEMSMIPGQAAIQCRVVKIDGSNG